MTDIVLNSKGEMIFYEGNEWKANNLLHTKLGSIIYFLESGFDFNFWNDPKMVYPKNNFLTELNNYLLENNIAVGEMNSILEEFILKFKVEIL